ncbi:MAG TPA: Fe-Mn family superoxide dismutase [Verrucomicrobiae bacterium]|nr:Fe-Mn family superoxide dismutase [Verrucomicrobiae bacterium]
MVYQAKNYDTLYGTPGFSDELLGNHFTLYQGYVKNTNALLDEAKQLRDGGKEKTPEFAETRRRFGWEFNGMRLHEYYFENLRRDAGSDPASLPLVQKLAADFGSFDSWQKDFKATAAMRGIGWAALYYDTHGDRLMNFWINEHDTGHGSGLVPILILDVFEHAYMKDYGIKRDGYLESFFKAVHWQEAQKRFQEALVAMPHGG